MLPKWFAEFAYILERVHIKIKCTSFQQILTTTALKIFDGRQPAYIFSPSIRQNYARKLRR